MSNKVPTTPFSSHGVFVINFVFCLFLPTYLASTDIISTSSTVDFSNNSINLTITSQGLPESKNRLAQVSRQSISSEDAFLYQVPRLLGPLQIDTVQNLQDMMRRDPNLLEFIQQQVVGMAPRSNMPNQNRTASTSSWTLPLYPLLATMLRSQGITPWSKSLPRSISWRPNPEISSLVIYADEALPWFGMNQTTTVKPVILPNIVDEDGQSIITYENISPQWFSTWGVVAWTNTTGLPKLTERTGKAPYVIKARGIYGKVPGSLVLAKTDIDAIIYSPSAQRAILEGRIIIVINSDDLQQNLVIE